MARSVTAFTGPEEHATAVVVWDDLRLLVCRCGWFTQTHGIRDSYAEHQAHVMRTRHRAAEGA